MATCNVAEVSTDQTKLYVMATQMSMQTGFSNLKLFTIDTASHQVLTSIEFADTRLDLVSGGSRAAFSQDQKHVVIVDPQSIRRFSINGVLEKTISHDEGGGDTLRQVVITDEDAQNVTLAYVWHTVSVNLETGEKNAERRFERYLPVIL